MKRIFDMQNSVSALQIQKAAIVDDAQFDLKIIVTQEKLEKKGVNKKMWVNPILSFDELLVRYFAIVQDTLNHIFYITTMINFTLLPLCRRQQEQYWSLKYDWEI